jgi:hypothetical protein
MTDSRYLTRRCVLAMAGMAAATALAGTAGAQTARQKKAHPRIARAIEELRAIKDYLEKSPKVFGGRKEKAITALEVAIVDLKLALEAAD